MQEILLNIESKEIRLAELHHGQLHNLTVERKKERQITGNIYRGRVTNILNNIQSAFIDIHEGENGFIHISDILENTEKFQKLYELDFELINDKNSSKKNQNVAIDQLLRLDQPVLVQVVKEPIGSKGARLTSNVSIAGRYLVLLPNSRHRGVSRKIEDRGARDRLKKFILSFEMPQDMGLICRTASCMASPETLIEEANELFQTWNQVMEKFQQASSPTLLYQESDLIKRAITRAVDKRFERILIDDYKTFQRCRRLYQRYASEHPLRIEFYRDCIPIFDRFNVENEIEKSLKRKIWLPGGGYLFLEHTEAMFTIDVNSGRSSGSDTNVEETLVRINLEAAEEVARQLRLRNVGGLIIIDFIDMRFRRNQRRVLDRLREHMKEDAAKCTILGMSEFGLVEMTRQRNRESLTQTLFSSCPYCQGSGHIKNRESVSIEIERALKKIIGHQHQYALKLIVHPHVDHFLQVVDKEYLRKLAEKMQARLEFATDDSLHLNTFEFYSTTNQQQIDV